MEHGDLPRCGAHGLADGAVHWRVWAPWAERVDLVLIDGDHSYEGAKSDFQRWGNRVRVGGHVLMDDALPLGSYVRFADVIGRVVTEVLEEGRFREVRSVDRIVHLQRVE